MEENLKRYTVFIDGNNSVEVIASDFETDIIGGTFRVVFFDKDDNEIGYFVDVAGVMERIVQ